MKLVELPKGFIPPELPKKKRSEKFVLYFLIYLCVSYLAKNWMEKNSVKEINRTYPNLTSSVESLPAQEQEQLRAAIERVVTVLGKYLSPHEFDQAQEVALRESRGTATIEDLKLTRSLWAKAESLASDEEKKTLNEWLQISRKLTNNINVPGEVASPEPRGNVLIKLLLAPISFISDPVGYITNDLFYIMLWVIALTWYGLRQRKRSKALKDKINDQEKKTF